MLFRVKQLNLVVLHVCPNLSSGISFPRVPRISIPSTANGACCVEDEVAPRAGYYAHSLYYYLR